MNNKEIKYVIAIAEEESITNAAKKLFLSQSTLSHALNKIEEDLGAVLFDRSTIPLKLTNAGKVVFETGQKIIALDQELQQQVQDISEFKRGSLTLGLTNLAERYYFPLVMPKFRKKYPGVQIITKVDSLANLEILLLKHKVDFAIILPTGNPLLEHRPIFTMDILLALPIDHPLCKKYNYQVHTYPEIDLKELVDEEFIILQQGRKIRDTALEMCDRAGFKPNVVLEVSNFDTAHALVAAGYGVTFVLDVATYYLPRQHKVAYFRIKNEPLYQTMCLGHLKNKYLPKLINSFLQVEKVL